MHLSTRRPRLAACLFALCALCLAPAARAATAQPAWSSPSTYPPSCFAFGSRATRGECDDPSARARAEAEPPFTPINADAAVSTVTGLALTQIVVVGLAAPGRWGDKSVHYVYGDFVPGSYGGPATGPFAAPDSPPYIVVSELEIADAVRRQLSHLDVVGNSGNLWQYETVLSGANGYQLVIIRSNVSADAVQGVAQILLQSVTANPPAPRPTFTDVPTSTSTAMDTPVASTPAPGMPTATPTSTAPATTTPTPTVTATAMATVTPILTATVAPTATVTLTGTTPVTVTSSLVVTVATVRHGLVMVGVRTAPHSLVRWSLHLASHSASSGRLHAPPAPWATIIQRQARADAQGLFTSRMFLRGTAGSGRLFVTVQLGSARALTRTVTLRLKA